MWSHEIKDRHLDDRNIAYRDELHLEHLSPC
jgi:hypothetical protein